MNAFLQKFVLFTIPFYPFWAWFFTLVSTKSLDFFYGIFLLPFAVYFIISNKKTLPRYLLFFILFTIYHISSAFINDTIPKGVNPIFFIFSDINVIACILLLTIENVVFETKILTKLNQCLYLIVFISLVVSLIQLKYPLFFFSMSGDPEYGMMYIDDSRIFSIYSWVNYHSLGTSFPIFISILLSQFIINNKSNYHLISVFVMGFVVCFLSRYRFAIISALLVSSQLMLVKFKNKTSLFFIAVISIVALAYISEMSGFKIEEVINNRILEKESDMGSAKARILSYEVFFLVFPENPLVGVGPATRPDVVALLGGEAPVIHIGYLSYLYYYGVFGFLLLVISLFFLLKEAWIVGKKHNFWGSFYGLVSFCIANISFVYFNFGEMGIILSIIYLRYYYYKSTTTNDAMQLDTNDRMLIDNKVILSSQT
jgi:hypothetical protein